MGSSARRESGAARGCTKATDRTALRAANAIGSREGAVRQSLRRAASGLHRTPGPRFDVLGNVSSVTDDVRIENTAERHFAPFPAFAATGMSRLVPPRHALRFDAVQERRNRYEGTSSARAAAFCEGARVQPPSLPSHPQPVPPLQPARAKPVATERHRGAASAACCSPRIRVASFC